MTPPLPRARPRDLGVRIGSLTPGPTNSIVDVANVRVGHATVWRDEPPPPDGRGMARTGVTAIVPFDVGELFRRRVPAGAAVLNGAGEAIGITTIQEWGVLETPILLTSSMAIGRVYDAAVATLVDLDEAAGIDDALMPVVAECDDGWLNASRRVQVEAADVEAALADAAGPEARPRPRRRRRRRHRHGLLRAEGRHRDGLARRPRRSTGGPSTASTERPTTRAVHRPTPSASWSSRTSAGSGG